MNQQQTSSWSETTDTTAPTEEESRPEIDRIGKAYIAALKSTDKETAKSYICGKQDAGNYYNSIVRNINKTTITVGEIVLVGYENARINTSSPSP